MIHECTIAGRTVSIAWTVEAQRRLCFRMADRGVAFPDFADLTRGEKSSAAVVKALWLLLPAEEYARHATPEDLAAAIDLQTEAAGVARAVFGVLGELLVSEEKKTQSGTRHGRGWNSGSAGTNGTGCTRKKRAGSSTRGGSAKNGSK